jgi:hypothetical protein
MMVDIVDAVTCLLTAASRNSFYYLQLPMRLMSFNNCQVTPCFDLHTLCL